MNIVNEISILIMCANIMHIASQDASQVINTAAGDTAGVTGYTGGEAKGTAAESGTSNAEAEGSAEGSSEGSAEGSPEGSAAVAGYTDVGTEGTATIAVYSDGGDGSGTGITGYTDGGDASGTGVAGYIDGGAGNSARVAVYSDRETVSGTRIARYTDNLAGSSAGVAVYSDEEAGNSTGVSGYADGETGASTGVSVYIDGETGVSTKVAGGSTEVEAETEVVGYTDGESESSAGVAGYTDEYGSESTIYEKVTEHCTTIVDNGMDQTLTEESESIDETSEHLDDISEHVDESSSRTESFDQSSVNPVEENAGETVSEIMDSSVDEIGYGAPTIGQSPISVTRKTSLLSKGSTTTWMVNTSGTTRHTINSEPAETIEEHISTGKEASEPQSESESDYLHSSELPDLIEKLQESHSPTTHTLTPMESSSTNEIKTEDTKHDAEITENTHTFMPITENLNTNGITSKIPDTQTNDLPYISLGPGVITTDVSESEVPDTKKFEVITEATEDPIFISEDTNKSEDVTSESQEPPDCDTDCSDEPTTRTANSLTTLKPPPKGIFDNYDEFEGEKYIVYGGKGNVTEPIVFFPLPKKGETAEDVLIKSVNFIREELVSHILSDHEMNEAIRAIHRPELQEMVATLKAHPKYQTLNQLLIENGMGSLIYFNLLKLQQYLPNRSRIKPSFKRVYDHIVKYFYRKKTLARITKAFAQTEFYSILHQPALKEKITDLVRDLLHLRISEKIIMVLEYYQLQVKNIIVLILKIIGYIKT